MPPHNDVDIFAQDLGFIAIVEKRRGRRLERHRRRRHGHDARRADTFPRTADVLGFCTPEQAIDVGEKVLTVQRDWGNREVRKHARLKYTIEARGLDAFRAEVERRLRLQARSAAPLHVRAAPATRIGWHKGCATANGISACSSRTAASRIGPGHALRTALREIAGIHKGELICTANQNVIIAGATAAAKKKIDAILAAHGIAIATSSGLRRNRMACVALPTCALALAESERFLPELVTALEDVLDRAGLRDDDIVIRMTGCPNGCARPYLAEIGLVGRGPGLYNLYLGAAFDGSRLNKLVAQDVDKARIVATLEPMLLRLCQGAQRRRALRRLRHPRRRRRCRPRPATASMPTCGLDAGEARRMSAAHRHKRERNESQGSPTRARSPTAIADRSHLRLIAAAVPAAIAFSTSLGHRGSGDPARDRREPARRSMCSRSIPAGCSPRRSNARGQRAALWLDASACWRRRRPKSKRSSRATACSASAASIEARKACCDVRKVGR